MRAATSGFFLALIDAVWIVATGARWKGLQQFPTAKTKIRYPRLNDTKLLGASHMPRVFSLELYYAHCSGVPLQKLAEEINLPVEWVEERVEAARDCVEFELPRA